MVKMAWYGESKRSRPFMKLWLPKDIELFGARIGIRLCSVSLIPGRPFDECLRCNVELINRSSGCSYTEEFDITYSFADKAFHFPSDMNQTNVWEMPARLCANGIENLHQARVFTNRIQRSCERILFCSHDQWMEQWLMQIDKLPKRIFGITPEVVMSVSFLKTDQEGNILSKHTRWPSLEKKVRPQVSIRRNRKRSIIMQKDNILIRVPFEEREKAKELGLKWNGKQQSWVVPNEMELPDVKKVLSVFGTQTPEEALEFAKEQRQTQAFKAYQSAQQDSAQKKEPEQQVEQEPVSKQEAQKNRNYLERTIYPYARLYLRPKRYDEEERANLKANKAIYDPDNKRWCVDRRLAVNAFVRDIPDYIVVPIEEKDKVKDLGAKWDHVQRSWYVPEGTDAPELNVYPRLKDLPVRNYIAVPAEEEKTVKELGALFDEVAKAYFIPRSEDASKFERWKLANMSPAIASHPKLSDVDRERMNKHRERAEQHEQKETQSQHCGRKLSRSR